jgi:SEC-C motif-containing protein
MRAQHGSVTHSLRRSTILGVSEERCPCGRVRFYEACCGRVHEKGAGVGVTAEHLMRARYSAYVLGDTGFLLRSWHPDVRPTTVSFDPDLEWLGLDVERTEDGGGFDTEGVVEFRARFRRGDDHLELHEVSTFTRVDGLWVYVAGD